MNPQNLMALMGAWNEFTSNHPKFPAFIQAINSNGIKEDCIIEISVTDPDGKKIETNIKVKGSDIQLFETIKNMR